MESKVYNQEGKEAGKVKLPEALFGLKWNQNLIYQVLYALASNARTPVAHTKDRGEVRGGGKKPWRQKGTGRARHGSRRSPLWRHGGVTFGPRNERNFKKKINKKMKTRALRVLLSQKMRDSEVIFLDGLNLKEIKAREAKSILYAVEKIAPIVSKKRNAAYISVSEKNPIIEKSFQNFGNITVGETRNINVSDMAKYKYLVIVNPEKSFKILLKEKSV